MEQRLSIVQDRRVEAFGEPTVDGREEITGCGALALITPEAGQAGGGTWFPEFGTLPARHSERFTIALLGFGELVKGQQKCSAQPM